MAKEESPGLDRLSLIHADGSRQHPQPADVHGRFVTGRRVVFAILITIYVSMPFIRLGGHPAMQFDIAARRFYLFGAVFNAQDGWRLVFLLLTIGTALFFVTTWYGRIWCGWACPQTVFLEGVFRRIERLIEGPREQRIRVDAGPWTPVKILRKGAKHVSYVVIALFLANVFIAFFVSLPSLWDMVRRDPRENWIPFAWVMALTGIMYFNFSWFREQLCVVLCPYGRLQSVLLDRDSIIIGYDAARGEPRGKIAHRDKASLSLPVLKNGDCVDCGRCVVVCPTRIDIRNGSQLECVGCAQCIDACDDVMTRLHKPKGLIRYDSLAGLQGQSRRVLRPRLLIYGLLVLMAATSLVLVAARRTPFEANIVRINGAPYVLEGSSVRNQYELHLVNKNAAETIFHVEVSGPLPVSVTIPEHDVRVSSLEHYRLPIFVSLPRSDFKHTFDLAISVQDSASGQSRVVTVPFLGPIVPPS